MEGVVITLAYLPFALTTQDGKISIQKIDSDEKDLPVGLPHHNRKLFF